MADDFVQKTATFIEWFFRAPSTTLSTKIKIADLRQENAGRGIVAIADIDEDEELFSLPRSLILSPENSELSSVLPHIFNDLDPWLSLILVLIYEHLKGSNSIWAPYLGILPERFDTLMFWSDAELEELQASAVRNKIGKEDADKTFREQLLPLIRENADIFFKHTEGPRNDDEILALAHRAGSAIMAYAFDIEKEESQREEDEEGYVSEDEDEAIPKGMVPLADILNADADRNNARLFYGASSLSMKALKPIKAGQEVLNDYGPLPRADMLRRYGYITDNYARYDVVEIPQSLIFEKIQAHIPSAKELQDKVSYLDEQGVLEDGYDIVNPSELGSAFTPELLIVVNSLLLSDTDFKRIKTKGTLAKPKMTAEAAAVLQKLLKTRASQYATSIVEDKAMLAQDNLPYRKRMAVQVRLGEKTVLQMALEEFSEIQKNLQPEENATKNRTGPNGAPIGHNKKPRVT